MKVREKNIAVKKTVLSAMFCALGVVFLWVGGMLGDLDLTIAALTSLIVMLAVIELGMKYAILIYAVTSVLALILFPAYFITPIYVLFIGYYPIIKSIFEKLPLVLSFILKLAVENVMFIIICYVGARLFGFEEETAFWILLLLVNVAFVVFDYALSMLVKLYYLTLRKRLGIWKLLK